MSFAPMKSCDKCFMLDYAARKSCSFCAGEVLQDYLKLVKGFIHEANEPVAVFKHKETYCALLHNTEWDNYCVLMVHSPTMTIPYNVACKSKRSAKSLFDKLNKWEGADLVLN